MRSAALLADPDRQPGRATRLPIAAHSQRDRLREELTLAQIDRHTSELEALDVAGILAFAERILPRASDPWPPH
jgi:hypothetical protein